MEYPLSIPKNSMLCVVAWQVSLLINKSDDKKFRAKFLSCPIKEHVTSPIYALSLTSDCHPILYDYTSLLIIALVVGE